MAVATPSPLTAAERPWFEVADSQGIDTPALLVYQERLEENIDRAIAIAGTPSILRPHVKTHKLGPVIARHVARGIDKFKAATVAEAEMVASAGGTDVLLALQPVGGKIGRLLELCSRFPKVRFSTLIDAPAVAEGLSSACVAAGRTLDVWLDIDCGMGRTGIAPERAAELATKVSALPGLRLVGLHAYDGHIHDLDLQKREEHLRRSFAPVHALWQSLRQSGLGDLKLVAGGTSTFPMHARASDGSTECSPGTYVFWDAGYAAELPDLDFLHAACVLTRVISKPAPDRLCLDLGHKAIASEMPQPRVVFPLIPDAKPVMHSEEHLVIQTQEASRFAVGEAIYGIPWHICPTTALHAEVVVINDGRVSERWPVLARARKINI